MTRAGMDTYIWLMEGIKPRVELAGTMLGDDRPEPLPYRIETAAQQMRMAMESTALASLSANHEVYSKAHARSTTASSWSSSPARASRSSRAMCQTSPGLPRKSGRTRAMSVTQRASSRVTPETRPSLLIIRAPISAMTTSGSGSMQAWDRVGASVDCQVRVVSSALVWSHARPTDGVCKVCAKKVPISRG